MRTPEYRVARDGTESWRIRFRLNGLQTSETFYDKGFAHDFCKTLDTLGPTGALAWLEREIESTCPVLDEWATRHIDALTGITEGTRGEYRRMYKRRWSPTLGRLPLDVIDREAIARVVNTEFADAADKTVRNYHGLLSAILASAVEEGHITRNPCRGMRLPRRTDHSGDDMHLLSQPDLAAIVTATPEHWRPVVTFLAGTGCRWGEAAALTVADVRLDDAEVTIRRGVKWARGGDAGGVGPTKTRRSRRTVSLPTQLVAILRPLTAGKKRSDLVFTAPLGGPIRQGNFYTRVWVPACNAASIKPRPRIHDLRHSHASWLIARGVPLPVIQRRLGHESITTTVDTYGHLAPDIQRAAAEAADLVLNEVGHDALGR